MTGPRPGELVRTRPGFLFVVLYKQGWWLGPPMGAFAVHATMRRLWTSDPAPWLVTLALAWLLAGLLVRILAWRTRSYVVSDRELKVRAGLLRRVGAVVPLRRIQHTTVSQSIFERIFGLGTVGVATAGADGPAVNLLMIPEPHQFIETLRRAAAAPPRVPVIGLAGGIGAGKSEVARALADLGCHVIDSDQEARLVLERPDVKGQLVQWWGSGVLTADGKSNRAALADIVFKSPADRTKLEGLIHPLVQLRRSEFRRAAQAAGAKAVVVDAPLLFEAGVDKECDAVIFVDAPRAQRLARVQAARGWSEAELDRREKAQMPIEEKHRRATHILQNTGTAQDLRRQTEILLKSLLTT